MVILRCFIVRWDDLGLLILSLVRPPVELELADLGFDGSLVSLLAVKPELADLGFDRILILDDLAIEPELVDLGFDFGGSLIFDDLAVEPELTDLGFDGSLTNASNK